MLKQSPLRCCFINKNLRHYVDAGFIILRHSEVWKTEESVCEAIASESELALRRSRLLFFLVSWISFTKTSRSFHYVSTHFCFCNFETTFTSFTSATSRKTIHRIVFLGRVQIRSFQGLINEKIPKKDISLRSVILSGSEVSFFGIFSLIRP